VSGRNNDCGKDFIDWEGDFHCYKCKSRNLCVAFKSEALRGCILVWDEDEL
jgi:hypothetical protein